MVQYTDRQTHVRQFVLALRSLKFLRLDRDTANDNAAHVLGKSRHVTRRSFVIFRPPHRVERRNVSSNLFEEGRIGRSQPSP